ncbi:MAG TPA: hypothetical protein VN962_04350 [Polyangia bacterium]|nr:hypothetical protein [Polyangia bacterium]
MRPVGVVAVLLSACLAGCWTQTIGGPGQTTGRGADGGAIETFQIQPSDGQLDLVFVIDDSGGAAAQQKLAMQIPAFLQVLADLPSGLPDLHVGVVSTDLGAGLEAPAGCTTGGDGGQFQTAPRGSCAATSLAAGAGFVSNGYGSVNFTDPIENVLQCIVPLGTGGCGFAQPLAALVRALGASGGHLPDLNQGFLRATAGLAIVILSAVDDCSTSSGTDLFKTDATTPGLSDPRGPLTHYRCNRYGHLCTGGGMMRAAPPLGPPPGGPDDNRIEQLLDCVSNDQAGGPLTPVADLVFAIRSLKPRPDDQIAVAAIVGPSAPYGVQWSAAGAANPQNPTEMWPSVMRSCGAAGDPGLNPNAVAPSSDGSSGEPAVRIAQFVQAFQRGGIGSICDPSYRVTLEPMAAGVADVARGVTCGPGPLTVDGSGQPACTVTARHLDGQALTVTTPISNCAATGGQLPCWTAGAQGSSSCPAAKRPFYVDAARKFADQAGLGYEVSCRLCTGACP